MALPKGYKTNIGVRKETVGVERRGDITRKIMKGSGYLPRGVMYEDLDSTVIKFFKEDLKLTLEGETVPVIFLTIQRWTEFSKTWEFDDEHGNIKMPFITIVRKPDPQPGENQAGLWNIPGYRTYTTVKVPTITNGREGFDLYQIPQPTAVDIQYEVRLFCNKMRDLNEFNSKVQKTFSSRQHYVFPNDHPMPLHLENIGDESSVSDFEERRFYVQNFEFTLLSYILDEKQYKVIPAVDRIVLTTDIGFVEPKLKYKDVENQLPPGPTTDKTMYVVVPPNSLEKLYVLLTDETVFNSIELTTNVFDVRIKRNDELIQIPFKGMPGDMIEFTPDRNIREETKYQIEITITNLTYQLY